MTTQQIEGLAKTGKLIASENGRTSRVGIREMYVLADGRFLTICRDAAQNGRVVERRGLASRRTAFRHHHWIADCGGKAGKAMFCDECGEEPDVSLFGLSECVECEQNLCEACFGLRNYDAGADFCNSCSTSEHDGELFL